MFTEFGRVWHWLHEASCEHFAYIKRFHRKIHATKNLALAMALFLRALVYALSLSLSFPLVMQVVSF